MPRDSNGNYSLPPGTIVNTGDTILPSQHNPAMNDLASAMSGSMARSGVGGMLAALPMNGFPVTGLAPGSNPNDAATLSQVSSGGVPIGTPIPWLTATPPSGYILAFGQTVSRTTYADLFAVLGTLYGIGDGVTTFGIPDLRGVVMAGLDNMGGTALGRLTAATTLGTVIGNEAVTLSVDQIPSHNHALTDPGHIHPIGNQFTAGGNALEGGNSYRIISGATGTATTGISIAATGGGQSHPNVQPSFPINYIIKATN